MLERHVRRTHSWRMGSGSASRQAWGVVGLALEVVRSQSSLVTVENRVSSFTSPSERPVQTRTHLVVCCPCCGVCSSRVLLRLIVSGLRGRWTSRERGCRCRGRDVWLGRESPRHEGPLVHAILHWISSVTSIHIRVRREKGCLARPQSSSLEFGSVIEQTRLLLSNISRSI